jgi:hypothetical protein
MLRLNVSKGEYSLVENRHTGARNTCFDKLDSDWSDWTGHGGPDSLDCGLIVTHISAVRDVTMINQGQWAYDYVQIPDTCSGSTMAI